MIDHSEITRLTHLAARAKTKVKLQGRRAITTLAFDEIRALAFVADLFLEDLAFDPSASPKHEDSPKNHAPIDGEKTL